MSDLSVVMMSLPKPWDDVELQIAGALNTGKARVPDLSGRLHPLFERKRWNCDDYEYETLKPSMHLATNLVSAGMQYIASFLSSKRDDPKHKKLVSREPWIEEIHTQEVEASQIYEAAAALEKLAGNVTWDTDYDLYDTMNAWGVNILTDQTKPWHHETWDEILAHDRRVQSPYRFVTIGIAGQYVDYIQGARPDSEERIRATWHAAITMVHEIGHFIWNCRAENLPATWSREFLGPYCEPYVNDSCLSELGIAFVSWIFDGHTPTTIATDKRDNPFKRPLIWRREKTLRDVAKVGTEGRLPYVVYWSMRTDYLQKHLTQSFWAQMGDQQDVNFHGKARVRLRPVTLSGIPKPASAHIRDWELVDGVPVWKVECGDRSPQPDTLRNLTAAEIELARLESQWAEEDKIKNIVNSGMENSIQNPLYMENRVKIDDGTILQDSDEGGVTIDKQEAEPLNPTTIEVRFYSLPDNHPSGDATKSETYNSYERWKYGLEVSVQDYDKADQLVKIWEFTRQHTITNRFTRAQAAEYCKLHGLASTYEEILVEKDDETGEEKRHNISHCMPESKFARSKKLSSFWDWDRKIIARIRYHILARFVENYYQKSLEFTKLEGDAQFLAWIFYGELEEIVASKHLSLEHLRKIYGTLTDKGKKYESYYSGVEEKFGLETQIMHALHAKAQLLLRHSLEKLEGLSSDDSVAPKDIFDDRIKQLEEAEYRTDPLYTQCFWDDDDWEVFHAQHKLPTWGSVGVYLERYYAYEYERKYGHPRYRPLLVGIENRLRAPGQEMYRFQVDIAQTSVGELKNAIYRKGHFPANCNLVLTIFNGGPVPLKDSDLLVSALWEGGKSPGDKGEIKTIITCEVDEPVPKSLSKTREEQKKYPTLWNRPQAIHRLTSIQKKKELVRAGYRAPDPIPVLNPSMSLEQRLQHIQESATLLEQAMQPDNGNAFLKIGQPISASVLLEQLEDYEDILEKRLRGGQPTRGEILDLLAEEEDKKKRKSHMREYVNAIKKTNLGRGENTMDWELEIFAPFVSKAPPIPVGPKKNVQNTQQGNRRITPPDPVDYDDDVEMSEPPSGIKERGLKPLKSQRCGRRRSLFLK